MNPAERREAAVRELLENPGGTAATSGGALPPGLYEESVRLGRRTLRRRRALRRVVWLLLCVAVAAFTWWAVHERPWVEPPSQTTPTVQPW